MLSIVRGSLLDQDVDAIVNPANGHLNHGGGLARIIDTAACGGPRPRSGDGPDDVALYVADHRRAPLIATGDAYATSAGLLPFKAIIHAVGPVWGGGALYERALLASAYQNACAEAYTLKCASIAVPAISCGVFGFPVREAAPVAVKALCEFWTRPQPNGVGLDVRLCVMEDAHEDAFRAAVDRWCRA